MIERLAKFLRRRGVDFTSFETVFDIGSRDGLQAVELANLFPRARIVAVECNPATLPQCRVNVTQNSRIKLVPKAINSYSGRCAFYPIDPARTVTSWADGNPGASSLFVATGDYPAETYVQNKVEVDCIRLDDLCAEQGIATIDLIWMDLQGAELLALQSAGTLLDKVRYIYTEISHRPIYSGQCLFDEVDAFLTGRGFRRCTKIDRSRWQQDIIYENSRDRIAASQEMKTSEPADAMPLELRLLLGCARIVTSAHEDDAIRRMLANGIDWTLFARKAIEHGLAGLAGHTLARVAPDMVPADILEALRVIIDRSREKNRQLFDELARLLDVLAANGIDAIPFKGPVLAVQTFGDLGLRQFRDLDFLIRDCARTRAVAALGTAGYQRQGALSTDQFDLIHRLQGQEIIFKSGVETAVEPHTRLTSIKMALDIDYAGLWHRARRIDVNGRSMLTLEPEDTFIILAIHGGKEMWWNIKWACDVAAFIASHPRVEWSTIMQRARAQGCLRMTLLATALARTYFGAKIPTAVETAERSDREIGAMVARIAARWHSDAPLGPPSNRTLSRDRMRLHDGFARKAGYVARTLFLPGPQHVGLLRLPKSLRFAYVPIGLAHDALALPLWRGYGLARAQAEHLRHKLAVSNVLGLLPGATEKRRVLAQHRKLLAAAHRALAADKNSPTAWRNLGDALVGLRRYKPAIAAYDKALAFEPDSSPLWKKRGAAMRAIGLTADMPESAHDPKDTKSWAIRAGRYAVSKRYVEAVEASDRALLLDPANAAAARVGIMSRLIACDWQRREDDKRRIGEGVKAGQRIITPFHHRAISDSEPENQALAHIWAKGALRPRKALWNGERYEHDKIRLAYMSTDFRDHVVADAIAGCFEQHDKSRFVTTAISLGPDDASPMRHRLEAAFDRFIDVQALSDLQVAMKLRELEVDVIVDLNGNSGAKRTGILLHRPAPVQVSFLGFPGTMGMPFLDYVIADRIVIPEEQQKFYDEKVVYLPDTYMPNDSGRPIAQITPSRTAAGLPQTGFVFACHNSEHKLSPEIFAVWMRILRSVEGSVLWLKTLNPAAMANLWREAKAQGIAPERIIFAPRVPQTEGHLARLRLADLFLDTLPYNAHATACDALWVGLPVLTCPGNSFPGRVAASVLHAIGLPELVASSLPEYEQLALALARDPVRLAALKAKLKRQRDVAALFDTMRFTRHLESAYSTMCERQRAGLPPASFAVAATP